MNRVCNAFSQVYRILVYFSTECTASNLISTVHFIFKAILLMTQVQIVVFTTIYFNEEYTIHNEFSVRLQFLHLPVTTWYQTRSLDICYMILLKLILFTKASWTPLHITILKQEAGGTTGTTWTIQFCSLQNNHSLAQVCCSFWFSFNIRQLKAR